MRAKFSSIGFLVLFCLQNCLPQEQPGPRQSGAVGLRIGLGISRTLFVSGEYYVSRAICVGLGVGVPPFLGLAGRKSVAASVGVEYFLIPEIDVSPSMMMAFTHASVTGDDSRERISLISGMIGLEKAWGNHLRSSMHAGPLLRLSDTKGTRILLDVQLDLAVFI